MEEDPPVKGPATPILMGSAAEADAEKPSARPATSMFNLKFMCHLLLYNVFYRSRTLESRAHRELIVG
jgi:hypothetical protein